jgi:predicted O-methyltransferase YrrM
MGARGMSLKAQLLQRAARSSIGRRALLSVLLAEPELALEPLGRRMHQEAQFGTVAAWPERLGGFHDLAFLFTSSSLNAGIARLAFDEAACLYGLVSDLDAPVVAEIGRFKGGSTLLLAAAAAPRGRVYSYDLHVKMQAERSGESLDDDLRAALGRYGLAESVDIRVGDSRTAEPPPSPCDVIFLDGDHSYEGVRADLEHWLQALAPDGHLLLHDAAAPRKYSSAHEGVTRLVDELAREQPARLRQVATAGSIVHYIRAG